MGECHLPNTCHVKVTVTRAAENLDDLLDVPSPPPQRDPVEAREQSEASSFSQVKEGSVSSGASAPTPCAPSYMRAVPLPGTPSPRGYIRNFNHVTLARGT